MEKSPSYPGTIMQEGAQTLYCINISHVPRAIVEFAAEASKIRTYEDKQNFRSVMSSLIDFYYPIERER